jgi:hypothetical protein
MSTGRLAALLLAVGAAGCGSTVAVEAPSWPRQFSGRDADILRIVPGRKQPDTAATSAATLLSDDLIPRMHSFAHQHEETTYGWLTPNGSGVAWISIQPGAQIDQSPALLARIFRPPFRHPNGLVEFQSLTPGAENGTPSVFLIPGALVQASGTEDRVRRIPAQRLAERIGLPGDVALAFMVQGAAAERIASEYGREPLTVGLQRATFFVRAEQIDARIWYDTAEHAANASRALTVEWAAAKPSCDGVGVFARLATTLEAETDGRVLTAHARVPDVLPQTPPQCREH